MATKAGAVKGQNVVMAADEAAGMVEVNHRATKAQTTHPDLVTCVTAVEEVMVQTPSVQPVGKHASTVKSADTSFQSA